MASVAVLVRSGDDVDDGREHALGELVHQRVREEVARGVGRVAVGEGEDLEPLVLRERRVEVCAAHAMSKIAGQPGAGVDRVDDALAVGDVGEAVGADGAGVVEGRDSA